MTKLISLISYLLIFSTLNVTAQLQLPKGFRCVLGDNNINESYFTNGIFSFKSYSWGHDGISGQDVIDEIEKNYNHKLKFKKTSDGLYWATGKSGNKYVYIILVDEIVQYTLSSTTNNAQFSNHSAWLLQQLRNNIASGKDNYFTDYRGKECSGVKQ